MSVSPDLQDAAAVPAATAESTTARRLNVIRDYGIVGALVALLVILALSSDAFLTSSNMSNILSQWAPVGIIAIGSTFVFIAGGFDLSVAAVYALAGVVAAKVTNSSGIELGIVAGLGVGLGVGVVNGTLVTIGRINPFIATLATSIIVEGLALALTDGKLISVIDPAFSVLGVNSIAGVMISIWLLGLIAVILGVVLHRTVFGRHVYAVGGNQEAARLSGLRVGGVRISTFMLSGVTAAIGGLIAASSVSTGSGAVDMNITFDAIIAIVLGGTSLFGGAGAVWRTVVGLLVLALIGNGFNLLGVEPVYQRIAFGGILLVAVALDAWSKRSDT